MDGEAVIDRFYLNEANAVEKITYEVFKLDDLRTKGFAMLEPFSPSEFKDIRDYLWSRQVYTDAHVPITATREGRGLVPRFSCELSECICITTREAILTPHVLERALSLTDVAAQWLERDPPVMYSINVFWTRPGPASARPDIQDFHRDTDDRRFLPMFVFLTDVEEDEAQEVQTANGVVKIFGPAGTVFLSDTSQPHRGLKPKKRERGIMWVRWGVSPQLPGDPEKPPANAWDKIVPIGAHRLGSRYPTNPRLRESIKLLVTP